MNLQPYFEDPEMAPYGPHQRSARPQIPAHSLNPYQPNQQYETPYEDTRPTTNWDLEKPQLFEFFQIARFPTPQSQRHQVIKYTFNPSLVIRKIKEYQASEKAVKKLLQKLGSQQYRLYPCFHLDQIEPPSVADLCTASSAHTNSQSNYEGFAPF